MGLRVYGVLTSPLQSEADGLASPLGRFAVLYLNYIAVSIRK